MPSWMPWNWGSSSKPPPPPPPPPSTLPTKLLRQANYTLSSLPPAYIAATAFVVGGVSALGTRRVYVRYLRRIPTSEWVTPDILENKKWIKGYVTKVGDADNFRLYHTPGIGWQRPFKFRWIPKKLKDETIHIRLAGVDAPERKNFDRPGQAFGDESMQWLKDQIEGKVVYCQLIKRDHYGRIVASAHYKPRYLPGWFTRGESVGMDMVREGWATVYEQGGAVYGDIPIHVYKDAVEEAQKAKKGMWVNGVTVESPAEYKRRYREGSSEPLPEVSSEASTEPGGTGRLKRWFLAC